MSILCYGRRLYEHKTDKEYSGVEGGKRMRVYVRGVCVCARVSVCVRERKRGRERESENLPSSYFSVSFVG